MSGNSRVTMWTRRTFYECADELSAISGDFRAAFTNRFGVSEERNKQILKDSSERGVEVLRILALSIRSEQDFRLLPHVQDTVGAVKSPVDAGQIRLLIADYHPPYQNQPGFSPLHFRDALNKIAHADPRNAGFSVADDVHDLLLSGTRSGQGWIAVISIIDLCRVIRFMPDRNITNAFA